MSRIHRTKTVPPKIRSAFAKHYGRNALFDFYWYPGDEGERVWGAFTTSTDGFNLGWGYQIYEHEA